MSVLKVLLVDDEILARNKLRSTIKWEKYGFTICGEAANGLEAISMIDEVKPNIIIFDVSMPVMDGRELSRYIFNNHKEIKMIALSSYDNFDYVRETLKNGVVDYLLKHAITPASLLDVLQKTRDKLCEEAAINKKHEIASKKWQVLSPVITQKYIRELILGMHNDEEEIKDYFENFQFQLGTRNIVVVAMQIINFVIIIERYSDADKNHFIDSIIELCNSITSTLKNGSIAYIEHGRFAILFSFENYRSENSMRELIYSYMEKIGGSLNRFLNISTVFGHSDPCKSIKDIPKAYKKAAEALDANLLDFYKSDTKFSNKKAILSIGYEKRLLAAIELLNFNDISSILEEIFAFLRNVNADYVSVQMVISELITIAYKAAQENDIDLQKVYNDEMLNWQSLKQYKKLDELKACIKNLYSNLIEALKNLHASKMSSRYVHDAINFISMNYMKDICLESVADFIGISSAYLSKLFKEEMHISFTEYLNMVRIEAAKDLMQRGEIKAKELYKKVGYNNYNYFIKVFKRVTGFTPLAFAAKTARTR